MSSEIKKVNFIDKNYDACEFIDKYCMSEKNINELDITIFKLKVIAKEFNNDVNTASKNLIKVSSTINTDFNSLYQNVDTLKKRYVGIKNNKDKQDLDKLHKAAVLRKNNENLKFLLEKKDKINFNTNSNIA